MNHLTALLLLLVSWLERWRTHEQQQEDQQEREFSDENPNAWFDAEFNADDRVQLYVAPDASRTDQANTD